MFMLSKKVTVLSTILLMVTLTLAIDVAPDTANAESPQKVKMLTFFENVVGIDIEAYEVLDLRESIVDDDVLGYTFASKSGNKLTGLVEFKDGKLTWCTLRVLEGGTPMLKFSYAEDLLNAAKDFLRRYSSYFNVSHCDKLTPLLDEIGTLDQDQLVVSQDASLRVKLREDGAYFEWICRVNDIEAPRKKVSFSFKNGLMRGFMDTWSVTTIGSTAITISEEKAKNMALNTAEAYINEIGAKVAKITAGLDFYNDGHCGRGDRFTLYPRWSVGIVFDKPYGTIGSYYVAIWADTGKVFHDDPQGYYGSPAPQEQLFDARIWIVILLLPAALAIAGIVYKRRRSMVEGFSKILRG